MKQIEKDARLHNVMFFCEHRKQAGERVTGGGRVNDCAFYLHEET